MYRQNKRRPTDSQQNSGSKNQSFRSPDQQIRDSNVVIRNNVRFYNQNTRHDKCDKPNTFTKNAEETYKYVEDIQKQPQYPVSVVKSNIGKILMSHYEEDQNQLYFLSYGEIMMRKIHKPGNHQLWGDCEVLKLEQDEKVLLSFFAKWDAKFLVLYEYNDGLDFKRNIILYEKGQEDFLLLTKFTNLETQNDNSASSHMQFNHNKSMIFIPKNKFQVIKLAINCKNYNNKEVLYPPKQVNLNKKLQFLKSSNEFNQIVLYFVEEKNKQKICSFELIDQDKFNEIGKIIIPQKYLEYTAMTLYQPKSTNASSKTRFIYAGQDNGNIDVWNIETKECVKILTGHKKSISSLSFIEGDKLVSGTKDEGHLYIWDVAENKNEKIGRFNSQGTIIQTNKNDSNQLIVTSSSGVFVIDDCVIKNYSIYSDIQWAGNNVIVRKLNENEDSVQIIGATSDNKIMRLTRNFTTKKSKQEQSLCTYLQVMYVKEAIDGSEFYTLSCSIPGHQKPVQMISLFEFNNQDKFELKHEISAVGSQQFNKIVPMEKNQDNYLIVSGDFLRIYRIQNSQLQILIEHQKAEHCIDVNYFPVKNLIGFSKLNSKKIYIVIDPFTPIQNSDQSKNITTGLRGKFLSNIAVTSDEMTILNDGNELIAQGDEYGKIFVGRQSIKNDNILHAILSYIGEVYDVKFIITYQAKLLLSLHKCQGDFKTKIIVTDLVSKKAIMTVQMEINSTSICIHPGNRRLSVIPTQSEKKSEYIITLAFQTKKSLNNHRDQNICTLMKGNLETQRDILPLMMKNMIPNGIFDLYNRINILNLTTSIEKNGLFQYCIQTNFNEPIQQIPNIIDSQGMSVSERLGGIKNELCIDFMLNEISKGNPNINLDKYLMFLGLTEKIGWVKSSGLKRIFVDGNERFYQSKQGDKIKLPLMGTIKGGQNTKTFEHTERCFKESLLEQHIDFTSEKKQKIVIMISCVPLNLKWGSQQSIEFLRLFDNLLDEAFETPFHYYLDKKWNEEAWLSCIISIVHLLFVLSLDTYAVLKIEFLNTCLIFFLIILIVYESLQIYVEGSIFRYLSQFENWFDLGGILFISGYFIAYYFKDEISTNIHSNLLCIGMLIANIRLMIHLSIFWESLRQMIMNIKQSIIKMLPFVAVLYCLLFTMAMCTYIVENEKDSQKAKKQQNVEQKIFLEVLFETYCVMFGENPSYKDIKRSVSGLIMYIVATNIINIICLNILISIVSANYSEILLLTKPHDAKKKAKLLLDCEKILQCLCPSLENEGTPKYIFHISYCNKSTSNCYEVNDNKQDLQKMCEDILQTLSELPDKFDKQFDGIRDEMKLQIRTQVHEGISLRIQLNQKKKIGSLEARQATMDKIGVRYQSGKNQRTSLDFQKQIQNSRQTQSFVAKAARPCNKSNQSKV